MHTSCTVVIFLDGKKDQRGIGLVFKKKITRVDVFPSESINERILKAIVKCQGRVSVVMLWLRMVPPNLLVRGLGNALSGQYRTGQ